jgi:uncharacterized membrane protein YfcA
MAGISIAGTLYRCFGPLHEQSWTDSHITRDGSQYLPTHLCDRARPRLFEGAGPRWNKYVGFGSEKTGLASLLYASVKLVRRRAPVVCLVVPEVDRRFMTILEFSLLVFAGSLVAGFLGALTGLGGGVVLVPMLSLLLGVDIRYAIGASLVSVIATSSGAAAAYVKEGFSNIRIGMFLEIATTLGALVGATLATRISSSAIAIVFGLVLIGSAYLSRKPRPKSERDSPPDPLASKLKLNGSFPDVDGIRNYNVQRVPLGWSLMFGAGTLSGLLGIGSGAMKVLAMDQAMKIPFKVSTTTSNFMIGVTAAASAGVYLARGYIDPGLSMPVVLGVLAGSLLGTRVLVKANTKWLRLVFSVVIVVLGIEMLYKGISGRI